MLHGASIRDLSRSGLQLLNIIPWGSLFPIVRVFCSLIIISKFSRLSKIIIKLSCDIECLPYSAIIANIRSSSPSVISASSCESFCAVAEFLLEYTLWPLLGNFRPRSASAAPMALSTSSHVRSHPHQPSGHACNE
jgi:hypothetical protein